MATPTTTETAVLEALVVVAEALMPAKKSGKLYRRRSSEDVLSPDFREYAQENAQACLRWFDIESFGFDVEQYSNGDVVRRGAEIEVVIAYPHVWGNYDAYQGDSTKREQALRAMLDVDMTQVLNAIGVNGRTSYPAGSFPMEFASASPEFGTGVTFGVATWPVELFVDTSP